MLPVLLGLSAAVILAGCAAAEPPPPPPPAEPLPEPELPEQNFTPAARDYYQRLTSAGYSSRLMDNGYLIGPWYGRYFSSAKTIAGNSDQRIDGLEVYLAILDLSEINPADLLLQGMLQEIIADPATRFEFAQALIHDPDNDKSRLWMAESLLRWSLRGTREASHIWLQLGVIRERLGDLHEADLNYRVALLHQRGIRAYSILMSLANVQRQLRHPALAESYERRAADLAAGF